MSGDGRVTGACLAAAAAVSLWSVRDSHRILSIPALALLATGYIVLSTLAACAVFFALRRRNIGCFRHTFFACVGPAALMPGTAILLSRHSSWGVVPATAIVWIVASGLRSHKPGDGFDFRRMSPLSPVAGGLVQITIALVAVHEVALAATAAAVGTMVVAAVPGVVRYVQRSSQCLDWRGTERKWLVIFANAFTLTCFALFPHVWGRRMPQLEVPQAAMTEEFRERKGAPIPPDDDVHQGIIIYPEEEEHAVLVPPIPALHAMAGGRAADPLSIPFYGVYWVFRPPYRRPPPKSLVMRADPAKRNLHSNDGRTLQMEARQNFGTYFDPACCSAITVVGDNRDPQQGSVRLELFVRDSADGKAAPAYVGGEPLTEQGEIRLRFPFPPALRRFDEVVISYKLQPWRRDRAPKVSIRRFVFEPR